MEHLEKNYSSNCLQIKRKNYGLKTLNQKNEIRMTSKTEDILKRKSSTLEKFEKILFKKEKMKLSTLYDKKGSYEFLESKNKALKELFLTDEINPQLEKEGLISTKDKKKRKSKSKSNHNYKYESAIDNEFGNIINEYNNKKQNISKKFHHLTDLVKCNLNEEKIFHDRRLKKFKPIKSNKNCTYIETFLSQDSDLEIIISQLEQN